MDNIEIIGYTKRNLSYVIRIGFADYGDFRIGTLYALSQFGHIYRPVNYNEGYYTPETLPSENQWIRCKELPGFSQDTKKIIETINSQFHGQSHNLNRYIRTLFEYEQEINHTSIHHIKMPTEYDYSYHVMDKALELYKKSNRLEKELKEKSNLCAQYATQLLNLKNKVFAKFFVGKLGIRSETQRKQRDRFIESIIA